jgi:hypothetical protein
MNQLTIYKILEGTNLVYLKTQMTILQSIEIKFGFQYPALYKQLFEQNRLACGEVCSGWHENVYPSLKDNPPFLLYGNRFKMLDICDPFIAVTYNFRNPISVDNLENSETIDS